MPPNWFIQRNSVILNPAVRQSGNISVSSYVDAAGGFYVNGVPTSEPASPVSATTYAVTGSTVQATAFGIDPTTGGGTGQSSFPAYSVLVANGTDPIRGINPSQATAGKVLTSKGQALPPSWDLPQYGFDPSNPLAVVNGGTGLNNLSGYGLLSGQSNLSVYSIPVNASTYGIISVSATSQPAFSIIPVAGGGTGQTVLPQHAVLLGNTNGINFVAPKTVGQPLISQGSAAAPVFGNVIGAPAGSSFQIQQNNVTYLTLPADGSGTQLTAGNLIFGSLSQRIVGDFSNAISSKWPLFQTNVVNGNTTVGAIPNGTGAVSEFRAFNNKDADNAGFGRFGIDATGPYIVSNKTGSGVQLPIQLRMSGTPYLTVPITGGISVTAGVIVDSPTGGNEGAGTINVSGGYYVNGVLIGGTPATGRSAGAVAAVASVAALTVGAADTSYDVQANVNVTVATTHNFTVTCVYTDETNTSRTLTLGFAQIAGATYIQNITNLTGTGPYHSAVYPIRCKAGTTVTIATTGTFTAVTYNVEGLIEAVA